MVNQNAESPPWITVAMQQDSNGLFRFKSASTVEAYIEEKKVKPAKKEKKVDEGKKDDSASDAQSNEGKKEGGEDANAPSTDSPDAEGESETAPASEAEAAPEPEPEIVRTRKFRELSVPINVEYLGSGKSIMEAEEAEAKMAQQDRLIKETDDARNDLETFVYSMRDAIGMSLKEYVSEDESAAFGALLAAEEEWLYTDEGYDSVKKVFVERLSKLQGEGNKFKNRQVEFEGRDNYVSKLASTIKK